MEGNSHLHKQGQSPARCVECVKSHSVQKNKKKKNKEKGSFVHTERLSAPHPAYHFQWVTCTLSWDWSSLFEESIPRSPLDISWSWNGVGKVSQDSGPHRLPDHRVPQPHINSKQATTKSSTLERYVLESESFTQLIHWNTLLQQYSLHRLQSGVLFCFHSF